MDGLKNESGRSRKVDGLESKWTVQDDSGRSFELKWTVPWNKSKYQSGRYESIKVDGSKVSNWTVRQYQTGHSKSVKVDIPKILKLASRISNSKCTLTLISPSP